MPVVIIYLSGPISLDGRATSAEIQDNITAFRDHQKRLERANYTVLCPLDNGLPHDSSWADHMRADIGMLMRAHEIFMLPRWQESRGASLELFLASQLGMPIRFQIVEVSAP